MHCKQFQYACQQCAISRRHVLAARLASFQVPSAEEGKRGDEWAWQLLSTLQHGGGCNAFVSDHSRVLVAVERPTLSVDWQLEHSFATPKVPCDCLKVGLDFVSNHSQILAAGRRRASVSQLRQTDDSDLLPHAIHSPPCPNLYLVYIRFLYTLLLTN